MNRILRLALMSLLLASSSAAVAQASELDAVLARLIDAYGGEHNLRKLDSQVQEWEMVALMGNRHGTDVRWIRAPQQLRVELRYPDKTEIRIVNGDASHVIYDGSPAHSARPPQSDAMRLQLMRLYSPLVLRGKRESLSLATEDGTTVITLFEHGVRVDYRVNPDTWRIEKIIGSLAIHGGEMQFVTEYSDFVMHEGVLVHRRENKFAGGVNTAVLSLRNVTLDAQLHDADFAPGETVDAQLDAGGDDTA
ncbi:MAG TPA: hypothetical protein VIS31_08865 [Woeseiaceae bacterium]